MLILSIGQHVLRHQITSPQLDGIRLKQALIAADGEGVEGMGTAIVVVCRIHFAIALAAAFADCLIGAGCCGSLSVGQRNALEFVIVFETPDVIRKIRCGYAAFVHLSAVQNQITAADFLSTSKKHRSSRLIHFCKHGTKGDCL